MTRLRKNIIAKIEHEGIHPRLGGGNTIPVNLLLRFGPRDLTGDSRFQEDKERQVESNASISSFPQTDWYWNATTEEFQETAP